VPRVHLSIIECDLKDEVHLRRAQLHRQRPDRRSQSPSSNVERQKKGMQGMQCTKQADRVSTHVQVHVGTIEGDVWLIF
jgi:hypothetical protein